MSHRITGIDHIQLDAPTDCEKNARKFFGEILGLKEIEKPTNLKKRGGVWFECGMQQLHIGVQQNFFPAKKAHPAFHVKNLEDLRRKFNLCGILVKEDEPLPNATRFYVDDPFGNRLEFLELKA